MTNASTPDLIPLAAAAVALGYTPASAGVLLSKGRFPVPTQKQGRFNMVRRSDVEAELQRRPHLTQDELEVVVKAHELQGGVIASPSAPHRELVEMLAAKQWVSTAEVGRALGLARAVVSNKHAAGTLPFNMEPDPASSRGSRRALSLDVARYLATQEPSWPTAEEFAAVQSLSLAEVKRTLGDDAPAGADDPTTQAFLQSRETISLADFALMLGVAPDTLKRRVQRGQVQTVEEPAATGSQRKLRRVPADYALTQLQTAS